MSIIDAIKKSVLEGFVTSLTGTEIVFGLAVAFLASLFILFIYQRTMKQVTLNRSFCVSLLLIGTISAMMVLTITSNLALSLGMVGALSIVRFRTALKDPADTAFLFWAVAAGITAGAGFYLLTLIGCLIGGLVCLVYVAYIDVAAKPFLLVVRAAQSDALEAVEETLAKEKIPFNLSSCVDTGKYSEAIYELGIRGHGPRQVTMLKKLPDVLTVSLVDCRKEA